MRAPCAASRVQHRRRGTRALFLVSRAVFCDTRRRLLIDSGRVDIERQDREGRTPLHWACHEAHVAVERFLELSGASTDAQDQYGRTPLSYLPQKARMTGARDGPRNVPKMDGSAENVMHDTLQPGHTIYSQGAVAQAVKFHVAGKAV